MHRADDTNWPAVKVALDAVLAEYQQRGGRFTDADRNRLAQAIADQDRKGLRDLLAPLVLLEVWVNPESRVKVARGKAVAEQVVEKSRPYLIEVVNDAGATVELRVRVTSGADTPNLFGAEFVRSSRLSGATLQYLLVTVRCREAGRREAAFVLDAGQGTQDLGFRSEVPVLFRITPEKTP